MKKLMLFLLLVCFLVGTLPAAAAPIYDPFLEKFQVGVYRDPEKITLKNSFPADLMESIIPDTLWISTADKVLNPNLGKNRNGRTESLLNGYFNEPSDKQSWLLHHHKRLNELQLLNLPAKSPYHVGGKFLLAERLALRTFLAYEAGNSNEAANLAQRLVSEGKALGLKPREIFVWDLRVRFLKSQDPKNKVTVENVWPTIFKLGSFDKGNAWAIWVAHQRSLGHPVLLPASIDDSFGRFLGTLRKTWLDEKEIAGAGFGSDLYSGLGAKILPKDELAAHFVAHPTPPAGLTLQGWWTRGQRRMKSGDVVHYEKLAARADLVPAWKMDIYRRASELHILAGNWKGGMVDLKKALLLAKNGDGTKGIRRRLRQWTEQAIALASAQGDTSRVTELLALGYDHFQAQDLSVFESQTERWIKVKEPTSEKEKATILISRGNAPDILSGSAKKTEEFAATADDLLWDLWFQWGLSIEGIQSKAGTPSSKLMQLGLAAPQDELKLDAIMGCAANRFPDSGTRELLLRMTLEFDIGYLSDWTTAPRQSPIPNLIKKLSPGPKGRHALLGVALTTGDLRGILAAAKDLPRKGITEDEKQRFLYPLPMKGSIRDAIEGAKSDPALILAVAKNESLFDPAVRSRAGALGFMQIMPFHYDARGANFGKEHWSQPAIAISYGDRLLQEGTVRYKGNPYMSLAGYNAGPRPTARWLKQLGGNCTRQEYVSWIGYPETRYYVEKVLTDREIYQAIIEASGNKTAAITVPE